MADKNTLKGYFVTNAIPTQSQFADLIDSMLIQDAGISKQPDNPLSITAEGDVTGVQKVINFYEVGGATNPSWSLQLNPRLDQNDPTSAKTGFCIADGLGNPRLFIDKATGNVGIRTITPGYSLDVKATNGIKLGLEGNGGGQLILTNDKGDKKIYLEAVSYDGNGSAIELLLTGQYNSNAPIITLKADLTNLMGRTNHHGQYLYRPCKYC